MRVFISGPITGTSDYEERFRDAEEILNMYGYDPINPVKLCSDLDATQAKHGDYMDICFTALRGGIDAIYMLDGWRDSAGACMEYGFAKALGIKVIE